MRDAWARRLLELRKKIGFVICFGLAVAAGASARAQTAEQAWLKRGEIARWARTSVRALGNDPLERTAVSEIEGQVPETVNSKPVLGTEEIIVGTLGEVHKAYPRLKAPGHLEPHGYWLYSEQLNMGGRIIVAGSNSHGALFGAFALLRLLAMGASVADLNTIEAPAMAIRWVDEWDNADGSIERGYAGRSIFFEAGHVRADLKPVHEYARLLASVGINGCNLNNVNGSSPFLASEMLGGIKRIADMMRPYGVRVALSVDIASPEKIGGLKTYDPLDPAVIAWWKAKTDEIYKLIPDFGGFTVKADSEGQPGPASYGRTPADAANLLAHALAPHGGVVLYRAFVYNHHLDWRDPKADRARAAYDIFHPLDGKFADNVIVQTKEGPIDFQAQEPVSPLFSGLEKTNQAMEVQITQEYTGQQRHLVYLAPMWKWVLDFDLRAGAEGTREQGAEGTGERATPVKDILSGKSFHRPLGGMVGVAGVGQDRWLNSPLALANLYAFGRLAWNPNLTAEEIAEEWTRQTIGTHPTVVSTVTKMLLQSWPAYVDYTGPLGMQTLTDITGSHYGPNIESSERNGWGQWHRADHDGVGMDRTVATGTGFVGQYWPEVARVYENARTTPDRLVLFFHHLPYRWKLQDGKTVIQYIYDSHYQGADEAAELGREWATLDGKIDPALFADEQKRLAYQAGHAIVWRDAIVQYFWRLSGIPDAKGRAGHFPGRYEAEDADLSHYTVIAVHPWEDASEGKAVSCPPAPPGYAALKEQRESTPGNIYSCTATWIWNGKPGRYNIAVQYFDLSPGKAVFNFNAAHRTYDSWTADANLPSRHPDGDNSTRRVIRNVELKPGDPIVIRAFPDENDPAALDYIEVEPR